MRHCAHIVIAMSLAACAGQAPKPTVIYQPVEKPVPVSCVPSELASRPAVPTPAELAKLSGPERYARMAAAYFDLLARSGEAEPVIEACRKAAAPP